MTRRGREDQRYFDLLDNFKEDVETKFSKSDAILREFADSDVLARLGVEEVGKVSVLVSEAVVIPPSMEKEVLDTLHKNHQATEAIVRVAKGSITFPGMPKKIKSGYEGCEVCKKYGPSRLKKIQEVVPDGFHHGAPMECLSCDHFDISGKPFLVTICRGAGKKLCIYVKDKTVEKVVKNLWVIFNNFSLSKKIPTDGATAFMGAHISIRA